MESVPYLLKITRRIPMKKSDVIFCLLRNELWIWNRKQYNSHEMVLMLIEILYHKKMINEATYNNIMNAGKARLRRTA